MTQLTKPTTATTASSSPASSIKDTRLAKVNRNLSQNGSQSADNHQPTAPSIFTPSLFARIRQYQPSQRLTKVLLVWWLVITFLSAFKMSNGFTINALRGLSHTIGDWIGVIGGVSLLIIALVAIVDLLCLISLSQPKRFSLRRGYPNNVPILHQLDIDAYLSVDIQSNASKFDRLVHRLLATNLIKSLTVDFYDDFPDHLALIEPHTSAVEIDTDFEKNDYSAMPIQVVIDIQSKHNEPNAVQAEGLKDKHNRNKGEKTTLKISYPVIAIERGTGYFGAASIRVWSPLKLFRRQFHLNGVQQNKRQHRKADERYLRVLADFSGLLNNQLSAVFEHSVSLGIQSILKQGHGSDFLKLREYTPGDAIRQIDWKATSRQRRLMSKSYEDDNDQDVMFLLDCGEQMRHHDTNPKQQVVDNRLSDDAAGTIHGDISGLISSKESQQLNLQTSYFDKVLNAVLLLSYVANKQSDRVGLMTFAGDELYVPPKKGASLIRNLLNETADLKPSMQTSDYVTAAQKLLKRLNKRSLIIVITNTRAEASDELTQALKLLSKRHQVVFANLTEQVVYDHLYGNVPPHSFDESLLYHALNTYQQGRAHLHKTLTQQTGALCLQTTANKLPMKLTQAYLSLKSR